MKNQPAGHVAKDSAKPMSAAVAPPAGASASPGQTYLEYAPLLRRVAMRKFNVPAADADALVHDVFISYLARPGNVTTDLRAYLIGAICNACRNYWRSRRTERRVFAPPGGRDARAAGISKDAFDGLALHLVVASTLAKLDARCREALQRYYLEGETTPTVAAALKTTPGNVNYLMHVCRKRARAIYDELTKVK